jgi:hypothetical protein
VDLRSRRQTIGAGGTAIISINFERGEFFFQRKTQCKLMKRRIVLS